MQHICSKILVIKVVLVIPKVNIVILSGVYFTEFKFLEIFNDDREDLTTYDDQFFLHKKLSDFSTHDSDFGSDEETEGARKKKRAQIPIARKFFFHLFLF